MQRLMHFMLLLTTNVIYMTLDEKNSHKGQLFEIEIHHLNK